MAFIYANVLPSNQDKHQTNTIQNPTHFLPLSILANMHPSMQQSMY